MFSEARKPTLHLLWPDVLLYRHILRARHVCGDEMNTYELLGLFGIGFALLAIFILIALEVFDG